MPFTLHARAKINLHLDVGPRRRDGYHSLRTVFQEISLSDTLRFTPGDDVALTVSPPVVPADDSNLILKALHLLRRRMRARAGLHVHLTKRIPMGAGLGGGSSDAAAALWGGWLAWKRGSQRSRRSRAKPFILLDKPPALLLACAKQLGADVSFFLSGGTAWATGIGERLTRLPSFPSAWIVLVHPRVPVATPRAYRMLDEAREAGLMGQDRTHRTGWDGWGLKTDQHNFLTMFPSPFRGEGRVRASTSSLRADYLAHQRVLQWREVVRRAGVRIPYPFRNDFEPVVFRKFPAVRAAFRALEKAKLWPVRMSGSGSTVFGVARSHAHAQRVAKTLRRYGAISVVRSS